MLPHCKWFSCSQQLGAVFPWGANPFEDAPSSEFISQLATVQCQQGSNRLPCSRVIKSLRGYARICMITLIAWLLKWKYFSLLSQHARTLSSPCHSGSPLCGQRELSITAQQPQGTAGIIAISFPATLGSAGTHTGFPSSLARSTRWYSNGVCN